MLYALPIGHYGGPVGVEQMYGQYFKKNVKSKIFDLKCCNKYCPNIRVFQSYFPVLGLH